MSNKNPYEVRLELLAMAKDTMMASIDAANALYWEKIQQDMEFYKKSFEEAVKASEHMKPLYPTPEEIMENAKKFYSFVCTKD